MDPIQIKLALDSEREWSSRLMAGSQPWIKLRVSLEQCREACYSKDYQLFIAHSGKEPVGFLLLQSHGVAGSPYIKSICIAEKARSKGLGQTLMQFAENLFRPTSKNLFLCVSSFNIRARSFYEREGYTAVGELKDYIIAGESEILMHKSLT